MRALVLGATGHLGCALARELCERGYRVSGVSRREHLPSNLEGVPVEVVVGDDSEPDCFERWLRGYDLVVDAAAPYGPADPDDPDASRQGQRLAGAAALVVARPRRAARRERDAALDAGRVAHHERVARRDLDDVPLEVVGAVAAQARLLVRAPEPPLVAARLGLGGAERRRERGVAQRRQRALVELGQALAQQRDAARALEVSSCNE